MADSVPGSRRPGFSTARVFSRAFGTVAANPFAALGIVLLFGVLPGEAFVHAVYAVESLRRSGASLYEVAFGRMLAGWAFGSFCHTLIQGSFVGLTSAHDAGRRTSFSATIGAGTRSLLPLIALGLITSLGTTIGFVALFVPGILLALLWIVSAPVLVEERCGVIAALGRSRTLTQGARWPILGIALLMATTFLGITILHILLVSPLFFFITPEDGYAFMANRLIGVVINAFLTICSAAVYTSIYVELRNWKHGTSEDAPADQRASTGGGKASTAPV